MELLRGNWADRAAGRNNTRACTDTQLLGACPWTHGTLQRLQSRRATNHQSLTINLISSDKASLSLLSPIRSCLALFFGLLALVNPEFLTDDAIMGY
jgi:hypothetical protein